MKSIVEEKLVSFKELEQKIFNYVCELGREITRLMLESYDVELASSRDTRQYRDKGKRKMDGVWLNMQDEHHKKMKKQEMKVFTMYEGWDAEKEKQGRSSLVEKTMLAGMEKSTEFHEKREGLLPYNKRGITIPEPKEGILYKGMGIQETQNCTVITLRMKHRRMRWSVRGANNLAKALYRKENKELIETIERYTDGLIFTIQMQKIVETLSAAKAPKKEGKGNPYADVVNAHMPITEAMQTASRKAFKRAFC